ncbi:MAG: hypothetical protein LC797_25315, partial [Chloroflexi bacterium]|nr:hypothetical protein [Chloroflexota bacterium]
MPRLDPARTRHGASAGSTLALWHPSEGTDAALAGHLVAVLFAAAAPLSLGDAARILDVPRERLDEVCELLDRQPPTGLALQRHADRVQLTT